MSMSQQMRINYHLRIIPFSGVLADPPYSDTYARMLYQTPILKPRTYLNEMVRVTRVGGLIMVYHVFPIQRPKHCEYLGIIAIIHRFNQKLRCCTIFRKIDS
jgi:hypothetical protein